MKYKKRKNVYLLLFYPGKVSRCHNVSEFRFGSKLLDSSSSYRLPCNRWELDYWGSNSHRFCVNKYRTISF